MRWIDVVAVFGCVLLLGGIVFVLGCQDSRVMELEDEPAAPQARQVRMADASDGQSDYARWKAHRRAFQASLTKTPAPAPVTKRTGRSWRHIVIHHSATDQGNMALFDRMHRARGWDEVGYHFIIDNGRGAPDGRLEVGPRWAKQKHGAHTGGTPDNEYNEHGIGICLVGNFMKRMPSSAQLREMDRLIQKLMNENDIPADNVIAHREAPAAQTKCCGDMLYRYLATRYRPQLASNQ